MNKRRNGSSKQKITRSLVPMHKQSWVMVSGRWVKGGGGGAEEEEKESGYGTGARKVRRKEVEGRRL